MIPKLSSDILRKGAANATHVKPSAGTPFGIKTKEQDFHDELAYRLQSFVLDFLDFIEEKIEEALEQEDSRIGAVTEAAGSIPLLRRRLREDNVVNANFILALSNMIEERWASEWWDGLAKMDRGEFERTARDLVGPEGRFAILRKIVAEAVAA